MKRKSVIIFICLASMLLLLQACGSGDDSSVEKLGEVGEQASKTITASDGGVLETESGSATLDIPADALAEDTELVVNTLDTADQPDAENLGSYVFDFGPDGLEFESPVTLSLKLASDVPEGKTAHIATLEDGKWKNISSSQIKDGKVSASITHFSLYVIIFKEDGSVDVITEGECAELDFEACGGDILGKWNIKDFCLAGTISSGDDESVWWNEYAGCDDSTASTDVDYDGYIEFKSDDTFENTLTITGIESVMVLDKDCLEGIGDDPEWEGAFSNAKEVCEFMNQSYGQQNGGCEYKDDKCTCTLDQEGPSDETDTITGYYQVDGNNVNIGTSMDSLNQSIAYCITDNKLVLEMLDFNDDELLDHMIFEKE